MFLATAAFSPARPVLLAPVEPVAVDLDHDLQRLAEGLSPSGPALVSLHRLGQTPTLLGCSGIEQPLAEAVAREFDGLVRFERRRRAEHEHLKCTVPAGGQTLPFVAWPVPVSRDAALLIMVQTANELAFGLAEAYLDLWWQRRCAVELNDGFRRALDQLDMGVVLLDGAGSIVFSNVRADRLLDNGDGLRRLGRSLGATAFEDAVRLQTAISMALQADAPCENALPLTLRRERGRPVAAAVVRIPREPSHLCDPRALVFLLDPDRDVERLLGPVCGGYGLTATEAQLVKSIVGGATLAEAADMQRIRLDTARSYLKQVFAKTGTHRQADLVRVILSGVIHAGPAVVRF